jgi:hypothetical protein
MKQQKTEKRLTRDKYILLDQLQQMSVMSISSLKTPRISSQRTES